MPGVHQRINPTSNHGASLSVLSACPWPWLHADHPPPGGRYKTMTLDNVHLSYEAWLASNPINYEHCFLCWTPLTDDNKTDEHVFPKWMQEEFSLFSQPLTLPNKTWISYRQVRIPCCRRCNNEALSRLEQTVASAVRSGFDDFARNVSMKEQFLWLQCLFYKMLYRDMSLLSDRADRESQTITSPLDLASMRLSHAFLRGIDCRVEFKGCFPASVYVVRTKTSSDPALNFDYIDSIPDVCVAIRMHDIGLIGLLRDGGLHEMVMKPQMPDRLLDREFNPVQFRNLFAKLLYHQKLFTDPLKYRVAPHGTDSIEISIEMKDKDELEGDYVYGPEDPEGYGQLLAQVLGTTTDALRLPDGSIGSLFFDAHGNWKERDFDDDGVIRSERQPPTSC